MDIIKKLFCLSNDDSAVIGLCKFSDDYFKSDAKERYKKIAKKDANLTQMLKRNY